MSAELVVVVFAYLVAPVCLMAGPVVVEKVRERRRASVGGDDG